MPIILAMATVVFSTPTHNLVVYLSFLHGNNAAKVFEVAIDLCFAMTYVLIDFNLTQIQFDFISVEVRGSSKLMLVSSLLFKVFFGQNPRHLPEISVLQ